MADTVRERIIQAFAAKAEILSGNPVDRCRRSMPASKEPFVSVWDGASTAFNTAYGIEQKHFQLGIEAAFISLEPSPDANALMGIIEQFFMSGDRTYGGLVKQLNWLSSQTNYPEDGSLVATVRVTYEIEFAHPVGDPYTNAETTP